MKVGKEIPVSEMLRYFFHEAAITLFGSIWRAAHDIFPSSDSFFLSGVGLNFVFVGLPPGVVGDLLGIILRGLRAPKPKT